MEKDISFNLVIYIYEVLALERETVDLKRMTETQTKRNILTLLVHLTIEHR